MEVLGKLSTSRSRIAGSPSLLEEITLLVVVFGPAEWCGDFVDSGCLKLRCTSSNTALAFLACVYH